MVKYKLLYIYFKKINTKKMLKELKKILKQEYFLFLNRGELRKNYN